MGVEDIGQMYDYLQIYYVQGFIAGGVPKVSVF